MPALHMKTFVVGDIHGRCAQLHNLLGMLPRDESTDKLVFLGDLIDRGPLGFIGGAYINTATSGATPIKSRNC